MTSFKSPQGVGKVTPATVQIVLEGVVGTVLDITASAWVELIGQSKVHPTDDEDTITDALRWEMDAEKRRRDPSPQLRFERETQSDDLTGARPTGLIDVYVVYSWHQKEYFAMECKKVDDSRAEAARRYIESGIVRFVIGKYSPNHAYGAMVGYVTAGTVASAAAFVGDKLVAYDGAETLLDNDWGWRTESRFGPVPALYSTRHGQTETTHKIVLVHLFFSF